MSTVIKIENVSKQYRLGLIGTNTLKGDLQRWWYNMRGLPDPTLMIGQENNLNIKAKVKVKGLSTSTSASASASASTLTSTSPLDEYVWALKDINFEVQKGEVLGIIGKNGAGKSTLLKLLSRVTAPTTGNIKIKGRVASLLEVGTGFHPELTGRENIFLNGAILGMTKAEIKNKLDEIIDFAGVHKYIDTPVKRYSSGMYVRLAFAVAAHLEPEILVVDEVLAVGDAEFQKKAIGKMHDVSTKDGRTVIFVSHNMDSILNLCTKGMLIEKGSVAKIGDVRKIVGEYLDRLNNESEVMIALPEIKFVGLINMDELYWIDSSQGFKLILRFETFDLGLDNISLDIGICDESQKMIIHAKSKFVAKTFSVDSNSIIDFHYKFDPTFLAPGNYYLIVYLFRKDKVLFWAERIKAFTVTAWRKGNRQQDVILDEIKGVIVPNFDIINLNMPKLREKVNK